MRMWAQFYAYSALGDGKIIEPCGDRSVIILDARTRPESYLDYLRTECAKRGYVGFSIHRGERFLARLKWSTTGWVAATNYDRPLELISQQGH